MKKIFLENLPRKGVNNSIDWFKTKGLKIKFIYDNFEGELEIVDVIRENNKTKLGLKYLDNDIFYMFSGHFMQCKIGEIIGVNTTKHYYNIGDIIETNTGKIKIKQQIRKRKNNKWYIYECLECGWENGQMDEYNLKKKQGCGCCSNKVAVLGINTVYDTDKWMLPYFINEEDAKTRTYGCNDKGLLQCPICKTHKINTMVCALHRDKDVYCDVCYDGFSYGEKYTYNLLKQLGIKVKRHKYFEWSRNVYSNIESLCGSKEYDFYIKINNEEIILETNGLQHYEECKFTRRTLYEETENDKLKQELAISKGIKENNYIIIDCRYSDPNYIKDNMLSNENLRNKFDLSRIDWDECEKHANSKYFLEALKYYNSGTGHMEIADIMEIDFKTVKRYLKRASEHGLCDFKTIPEIRIENKLKAIELWNNGIHNTSEIAKQLNLDNTVICDYLSEAEKDGEVEYKKYIRNCSNKIIRNVEYNKEFISINQAHTASKDIFGIDLSRKGITKSCDTGQAYKGLHFEYIDKNNIHI